jgi:hypothetical protein
VINTSIRKDNNSATVTKGIKTRRLRSPGIARVRLVINKLVNEIVELIPANITPNVSKSCEPTPVYLVLLENGVINVQPAVTSVRFEHLVK